MELFIKLGLILFIVLGVWSAIRIVPQTQVHVTEIFGKFNKELGPGFHLILPFGIEQISGKVDMRIQEVRENVSIKTSDQAFVELPVTVMLKVKEDSPAKSFYTLSQPKSQIGKWVLNSLRQKTASMDLSDLYSDRAELVGDVTSTLGERLSSYGYEIVDLLIDEPTVSEEMQHSFNRVIASKREREAAEQEAEAKRVLILGEARAEAESQKLRAEGLANARQILAESLAKAVTATKDTGLSEKELAQILLETNRLDTIKYSAEHGRLILMDLRSNSASLNISDHEQSLDK